MALTTWQVVKQSWLIHPDWTPEVHRSFLENDADECFRRIPTIEVIAGWLEQLKEGNR